MMLSNASVSQRTSWHQPILSALVLLSALLVAIHVSIQVQVSIHVHAQTMQSKTRHCSYSQARHCSHSESGCISYSKQDGACIQSQDTVHSQDKTALLLTIHWLYADHSKQDIVPFQTTLLFFRTKALFLFTSTKKTCSCSNRTLLL